MYRAALANPDVIHAPLLVPTPIHQGVDDATYGSVHNTHRNGPTMFVFTVRSCLHRNIKSIRVCLRPYKSTPYSVHSEVQ